VTVLLNDATHSFATAERFRAGTSFYGLDTTTATPTISTIEQSVSLAAGDFTGAAATTWSWSTAAHTASPCWPTTAAAASPNPRRP
jgi:hypothetical protein